MIRLGITGTDTSVGKTVVGAALVAWLKSNDLDAVAMKPIESGVGGDAQFLHHAAHFAGAMTDVCPISFDEPISPLAAAISQGFVIDVALLDSAFATLSRGREAVVVEGAGGILVPITESLSYAGLFARWSLDTIIVAADRLGVINHVLLTVMAAQAQRLRIKAIVLNSVSQDPDSLDMSRSTNYQLLEQLLPHIPIVRFSHVADPRDLALLVQEVEKSKLGALVVGGADPPLHRQSPIPAAHRS